jgi:hypothetical protein
MEKNVNLGINAINAQGQIAGVAVMGNFISFIFYFIYFLFIFLFFI